ncbi:hypothetical protein HK405_005870 [Cladochytrium tenue]|nr:hypothetical protein HK405_005870 [Cladochytrium tenue]
MLSAYAAPPTPPFDPPSAVPLPASPGATSSRGSVVRRRFSSALSRPSLSSSDDVRRSVEADISRRRRPSTSASTTAAAQQYSYQQTSPVASPRSPMPPTAPSPFAAHHNLHVHPAAPGSPVPRSLARIVRPRKGTVASLMPTPAVAVHDSARVLEAAAYMAAKRVDAILVVDSDGHLAGILTDKDIAFRVIAEGLDPRSTTVADVMTQNPVSVATTSSASDALNRMVAGHFRHLPVIESEDDEGGGDGGSGGGVVGVLDITKCLYEALERLERPLDAQRRATAADDGDAGAAATSRTQLVELFRTQLAGPDLRGLLASEPSTITAVSLGDTVLTAAQRMLATQETAVLVFSIDPTGLQAGLAGIFTSKDIVLRVVVAGLDPATTYVSRVMTPHPDCVYSDTSVLNALHKMHVTREGEVEGLVDVLKLTYSVLYQLNSAPVDTGERTVWNRFWEAAMSSEISSSEAENEASSSLIFPEDSASRVSIGAVPPPRAWSAAQTRMPSTADRSHLASGLGTTLPIDEAANFTFKLRDIETGKVHRITSPGNRLDVLCESLTGRLRRRATAPAGSPPAAVAAAAASPAPPVELSYVDDEGDFVHLDSDDDLVQAVAMARGCGWPRLLLVLDSQRALLADAATSLSGGGPASRLGSLPTAGWPSAHSSPVQPPSSLASPLRPATTTSAATATSPASLSVSRPDSAAQARSAADFSDVPSCEGLGRDRVDAPTGAVVADGLASATAAWPGRELAVPMLLGAGVTLVAAYVVVRTLRHQST